MIAVILAAGSGTRLGRGPKPLIQLGQQSLAERAIAASVEAGLQPVLTVAPDAFPEIARLVADDAAVLPVPDAATGMSASLKAAARWAHQHAPEEPVLVWLVDQPGITAAILQQLQAEHRAGQITRASYYGVPGHPVLFEATDFQAAAQRATGDEGARKYLKQQRANVVLVECGQLGSDRDLDTDEDYRRWSHELGG